LTWAVLCAGKIGFIKVEVKGKSGDDGISILRLNLLSFQVFFQCKRYKDSVGASAIPDFRGVMVGRTDKGLFITTQHFTVEANEKLRRRGPSDRINRRRAIVRIVKGSQSRA
jgi:restriction system protein